MVKITKIELIDGKRIVCYFDNNEVRILDLPDTLNDKYANTILSDEVVFRRAQVGQFGEIFWPDLAEMRGEDGEIIPCAYDISPEFAYHYSQPIPASETI